MHNLKPEQLISEESDKKLAHMVSSMFACHKNVIVYYIEGIRQSTPYHLPSPNPVPPFCFEIKILLKNWKGALEIMECLSGRILHFKAFLGYLRFFINILFHSWDTSTNLHPHKVLYAQTVWSKFEVITQSCAGVMLICFLVDFKDPEVSGKENITSAFSILWLAWFWQKLARCFI